MKASDIVRMCPEERFWLAIIYGRCCITCKYLKEGRCSEYNHIQNITDYKGRVRYDWIVDFRRIDKNPRGYGGKCPDWELVNLEEN